MTDNTISDEMLVALPDGELAADAADTLHARIVDDPALAERFAILVETRLLLEADRGAQEEAVPERLLVTVAAADAR